MRNRPSYLFWLIENPEWLIHSTDHPQLYRGFIMGRLYCAYREGSIISTRKHSKLKRLIDSEDFESWVLAGELLKKEEEKYLSLIPKIHSI